MSVLQDGRKISVGDCALFKPPKDSPPLIGLIRWLGLNKENKLQLGVNWLYRSSELKLEKGTSVDSAPNEIFYSFHKDEIPAASLLHPCKVAFLPGGVELPTWKSSFVCRRVYDIANRCLWLLTDQDYIKVSHPNPQDLLLFNVFPYNVWDVFVYIFCLVGGLGGEVINLLLACLFELIYPTWFSRSSKKK